MMIQTEVSKSLSYEEPRMLLKAVPVAEGSG